MKEDETTYPGAKLHRRRRDGPMHPERDPNNRSVFSVEFIEAAIARVTDMKDIARIAKELKVSEYTLERWIMREKVYGAGYWRRHKMEVAAKAAAMMVAARHARSQQSTNIRDRVRTLETRIHRLERALGLEIKNEDPSL